jgi:hypothetical protein
MQWSTSLLEGAVWVPWKYQHRLVVKAACPDELVVNLLAPLSANKLSAKIESPCLISLVMVFKGVNWITVYVFMPCNLLALSFNWNSIVIASNCKPPVLVVPTTVFLILHLSLLTAKSIRLRRRECVEAVHAPVHIFLDIVDGFLWLHE